jgi:hypothetical protein
MLEAYDAVARTSAKLCSVDDGPELEKIINQLLARGGAAVLEYVDGASDLLTQIEHLQKVVACGRARVFVATVPERCD